MTFYDLRRRLVSSLRERVRSGEITERGLARMTGVSQPHLHNVLKEKRLLSLDMADAILRGLNMDVLDLIEPSEVLGRARRR